MPIKPLRTLLSDSENVRSSGSVNGGVRVHTAEQQKPTDKYDSLDANEHERSRKKNKQTNKSCRTIQAQSVCNKRLNQSQLKESARAFPVLFANGLCVNTYWIINWRERCVFILNDIHLEILFNTFLIIVRLAQQMWWKPTSHTSHHSRFWIFFVSTLNNTKCEKTIECYWMIYE